MIDVETRGLRHLHGIRTDYLNRARFALATVVAAAAALRRVTQAPIAGNHFGYGQSRAELSTQLPKGSIRYTGHGRNDQRVCKRTASDSHYRYALGPLTVGLLLEEERCYPGRGYSIASRRKVKEKKVIAITRCGIERLARIVRHTQRHRRFVVGNRNLWIARRLPVCTVR